MAATNSLLGMGKMGDLKRRLLFLLGALVVFRIGSYIPVPGIDPEQLAELFRSQRGGILDMFNMFSGGALERFSIFALGIMPYISASIIMQLMSVVSPTLEALKKEGEAGRRKITQYTRYGTAGLALFQSMAIAIGLEAQRGLVIDPGLAFRLTTMVTLTTGTMFLMWLGEQITERGVGNGISLIIFAGIAAGLPQAVGGTLELVRTGAFSILIALFIFAVVLGVTGTFASWRYAIMRSAASPISVTWSAWGSTISFGGGPPPYQCEIASAKNRCPRAPICASSAARSAAKSLSPRIRGPHAWRTCSLNPITKTSSAGLLSSANLVAAAMTRSRLLAMLVLLSMSNPIVAGASALEKNSMRCG